MSKSLKLSVSVLIVIILVATLGFYYGKMLQPLNNLVNSSLFIGLGLLIVGFWHSYMWLRGYGFKLGSLGFWEVNNSGFFLFVPPNKSTPSQRNLLLTACILYLALSTFLLVNLI